MFVGFTRFFDVQARYASRDEYAGLVREAAQALVAEGHLLAEDEDLVVANCLERFDLALDKDKWEK